MKIANAEILSSDQLNRDGVIIAFEASEDNIPIANSGL
jgi:hypothetical protein